MGSENFLLWTEESINALWCIIDFTFFGIFRSLFRSDTCSLGLIKNEASCTGKLMRFSIYTIVKLITNSRILMIEETIGTIAQGITGFIRFLDKFTSTAINIEWIITFFKIGVFSLEKKSIRT